MKQFHIEPNGSFGLIRLVSFIAVVLLIMMSNSSGILAQESVEDIMRRVQASEWIANDLLLKDFKFEIPPGDADELYASVRRDRAVQLATESIDPVVPEVYAKLRGAFVNSEADVELLDEGFGLVEILLAKDAGHGQEKDDAMRSRLLELLQSDLSNQGFFTYSYVTNYAMRPQDHRIPDAAIVEARLALMPKVKEPDMDRYGFLVAVVERVVKFGRPYFKYDENGPTFAGVDEIESGDRLRLQELRKVLAPHVDDSMTFCRKASPPGLHLDTSLPLGFLDSCHRLIYGYDLVEGLVDNCK